MSFELAHIWASMGLFSRLIAATLVFMGVLALSILFDRAVLLLRTTYKSRRFARAAGSLIDAGQYIDAVALAQAHAGSHLAEVTRSTLAAYARATFGGNLTPIERARREFARGVEEQGNRLRRGLSVLASIGSIAPFVGLLGTVVGIITAFQGIAATGSGGLAAVSAGISEALVETALGLCVAIPSVAFFNSLSTRIDDLELGLQQAGSRLLETLEDRRHEQRHQQAA